MKILAFDPGLEPGIALSVDGKIVFSSFIKTASELPVICRMTLLWDEIEYLIETENPDVIAVEDISVVSGSSGKFNNNNFVTSWLYGRILAEAWDLKIKPHTMTPSEWKVRFCNSGKADKATYTKKAKEFVPDVKNDNEAAAIGINIAAFKELTLESNRGAIKKKARKHSRHPK